MALVLRERKSASRQNLVHRREFRGKEALDRGMTKALKALSLSKTCGENTKIKYSIETEDSFTGIAEAHDACFIPILVLSFLLSERTVVV